jgi:hypothetical protein
MGIQVRSMLKKPVEGRCRENILQLFLCSLRNAKLSNQGFVGHRRHGGHRYILLYLYEDRKSPGRMSRQLTLPCHWSWPSTSYTRVNVRVRPEDFLRAVIGSSLLLCLADWVRLSSDLSNWKAELVMLAAQQRLLPGFSLSSCRPHSLLRGESYHKGGGFQNARLSCVQNMTTWEPSGRRRHDASDQP